MAVLRSEDYLFTDLYRDRAWLGIACRRCGARPSQSCRAVGSGAALDKRVPVHAARRHDLVMGRQCTCGKCDRGGGKKKGVDTPPQNVHTRT